MKRDPPKRRERGGSFFAFSAPLQLFPGESGHVLWCTTRWSCRLRALAACPFFGRMGILANRVAERGSKL